MANKPAWYYRSQGKDISKTYLFDQNHAEMEIAIVHFQICHVKKPEQPSED